MPNSDENQSKKNLNAAKRHRQNVKIRTHNRSIRSSVRTAVKAFDVAIEAKEGAKANSAYSEFVKLIDSATRKGIYHRNTAARKKSRMHKRLAELV